MCFEVLRPHYLHREKCIGKDLGKLVQPHWWSAPKLSFSQYPQSFGNVVSYMAGQQLQLTLTSTFTRQPLKPSDTVDY